MANYIALELDRREIAEMSCIAGIGGDVPHLVCIAQSGRPILAVDGCPFECVKNSLAQRSLVPNTHLMLTEVGVKKRYHTQFNLEQAERILESVVRIARALGNSSGTIRTST